jgi:hypothetical protein
MNNVSEYFFTIRKFGENERKKPKQVYKTILEKYAYGYGLNVLT